MREILFRGKRTDNGEWVHGLPTKDGRGEMVMVKNTFECEEYNCRGAICLYVDENTVGQYTGLKDKNGTKIFEGDIIYAVSNFDAANMVVVYDPAEFRLVLCEDYKTYKPGWGFKCLCYESFYMEVVGNIYDNKLEDFNNVTC